VDIETIKRIGRWSSSAVHACLWDTHERQNGMAAKMLQPDGMLVGAGTAPEGYHEDPKGARANIARRRLDQREADVRARAGREVEEVEVPEGGLRPPPSEDPGNSASAEPVAARGTAAQRKERESSARALARVVSGGVAAPVGLRRDRENVVLRGGGSGLTKRWSPHQCQKKKKHSRQILFSVIILIPM